MTTVTRSKGARKSAASQRHRKAAVALLQQGCLSQAIVLEWMALRMMLFAWLEQRNVQYEGTRDALVAVMAALPVDGAAADLIFAYHIATLAEWDEEFDISKEQAALVFQACARIRAAIGKSLPR